ncbi:MAG: glycosyltransferase [Microbacterium sp.]|nr:glycosyltransferase [Microbacterium sp.]
MRIVHVANYYAARSGGMRTTMHALGRGYLAAGHEFCMVVPGTGWSQEQTSVGLRVTVPSVPLPGTGYSIVPFEGTVRAAIEQLAPDRLEVSDRTTLRRLGAWARRQGIPTVLFAHERLDDWLRQFVPAGARSRSDAPSPITDRMVLTSLRDYDRIVCTTQYAAAQFERLAPGVVDRIPLGVDLETFAPLRHRARNDAVVLVHAARLSPEKAPHRSVRTLRELLRRGVDARLVVVGDGPSRARMERLAHDLPVEFTGFVSDRAILRRLLASADVSLNPGPIETFCLSAMESLACGTPAVAASTSAVGELLAGAGEVADPTPESFADAVERILARPESARRRAARARAEQFPWSRTVDAMLELHAELGNERRTG